MILSLFFLIIFLYHLFMMPKAISDRPVPGVTAKSIVRDFAMTFVTFFQKKNILSALAFMLLYRLPEAMCIKLVQPFLKAPVSEGGLGLSTVKLGLDMDSVSPHSCFI